MSSTTKSNKEVTNINLEQCTAARIRPVSVAEILSRRKEKLNIDNDKGGAEETFQCSENSDNGNSSDKDTERKKNIEYTVNENQKIYEERNTELENSQYESHDRDNINSGSKIELESNYSKIAVKKENKDVNHTRLTSGITDKSKDGCEKNSDNDSVEKDPHEEERMPRKEQKRKYESHVHGKLKSVIEGSIPKRHDSGRSHDIDYSERKEQNMEYYKTRHTDPNHTNGGSISKKHDSEKSCNVEYSERKDRSNEHHRSRQEEPHHIGERNRSTKDGKSHDEKSERKDRRKPQYRTHHEESICVDNKHSSDIDASITKKHGSSRLSSHDVEYSKKSRDTEYLERKTRRNENNKSQHEEPNQIDDKITTTVDRSIPKKYDYGKTCDAEYLDKKDRRNEHSLTYQEKTSNNDEKTRSNDVITKKHDSRNSRDTKYLEKIDQKRYDSQSHHEKREKVDYENRSKGDVFIKKTHDSHKVLDAKYLERKDKKVENTRHHYEKTNSIDDKLPKIDDRLPKISDTVKKNHESEKNRDIEYAEGTNPKTESRSQIESRKDSNSRNRLKDEDSVKVRPAENSLNAKYGGEEDKRNEISQTFPENKNYGDDKIKSKGSIPEKHESVRSRDDYLQRKGGTKEHSRTYSEEPDRRSSRSQERNQERNEYDKSRKRKIEEDTYTRNYRNHGSGIGGYSPRKRRSDSTIKSPPRITKRSPERKISTWDQPPNNKIVSMSSATVTPLEKTPQILPSFNITSIPINVLVDSVQLTQATRPMRSLYIENIPPSASEKSLIDWLNDFLMPSGINGILRAKPCISCIINKDKSQAVVEFLTPEDATSAICFDGRSMSGTVLKIRRPRDFVEATVTSEKTAPTVKTISEVVKDSPHKIFIGGISKALSSETLREVVGVFGLLRAYHFEFNQELNGPCAFLEYEDHTITQKACAGLNGMKLGGHIITAAQAFLDFHRDGDDAENLPSYDVPVHVKSLLADPTQVLLLKNMLNPSELSSISDTDLEEILEDVRLECTRFGTVKSINVVRPVEAAVAVEIPEQHENHASESTNGDNIDSNNVKYDIEENLDSVTEDGNKQCEDRIAEDATKITVVRENESEVKVNGDGNSDDSNRELLEPGSVLVEFLRKEAACAAAHCLHLRYYGEKIVMAGYISHDLYVARFSK